MTDTWFSKVRAKLNQGDSFLTRDLGTLFSGDTLGDDALEVLEERLLMADAGVEATGALMGKLESEIHHGRIRNETQLREALRKALMDILQPVSVPLDIPTFIKPFIVFVVGVNGAGKTTTIGKLAHRYKSQGRKVMLAAGDTFRAAAVQQLTTWAERTGTPISAQGEGADSASVIFDAVQAARSRQLDVVIADTAGRLHTQGHLMDELRKIKRMLQKHDPYAPHEVLLVVDGTTGGNALVQAVQFHEAVGLTGLVITKLDGTAKGGIVLAIAKRLALPIRYVGIGEGIDDLRPFDAAQYVDALLNTPEAVT
ncbi:signal recognition particle-docking protein FtsY [Polycyclovorans algicola]|uniref:signal recognition particle-docking protein FtsY n=1 Tax=Polycyclovorans algicola TaxID=616992 RepID=UPI0005BA871A|nr:signal recognition particle-docking protein FtsY [Polycyclovorans algicola]